MLAGAQTWFALVGSDAWPAGEHGHFLMPLRSVRFPLPDSDLFTMCHSVFPDEVRQLPRDRWAARGDLLSYFVRTFA